MRKPAQEDNKSKQRGDRAALRDLFERHGVTVAQAARQAGLSSPNAIYNYLNGSTEQLSTKTLKALSKGLGVTIQELLNMPANTQPRPGSVVVNAAAAAGVWRDRFDLPPDEQFEAPITVAAQVSSSNAYAVVVRGQGAEKIYPANTILVVVPIDKFRGVVSQGRRVVVQRINTATGKVEVTVREVEVHQGDAWLCSRTTDPALAAPLKMPWPYTGHMWRNGDEKYCLAGAVVQSLCFEP